MPRSIVESTNIPIPDVEGLQANSTLNGSLSEFHGVKILPTNVLPVVTGQYQYNYDGLVFSTSDSATGTVTIASVLAGDTVTVNGLVYTAVGGVKANNTEFSVDGDDTASAVDLADSITNDTRTGTIGDLLAANAAAVVTITSTLDGTAGDVVTLVSSDGGRLAVSGATLSGGTDGPVTVNVATRGVTIPVNVGGQPQQIASFFTSLLNDATAQMTVLPKNNKNSGIAYNVFYTAVGTGAVTVDLFVVTLRLPSGSPTPVFPQLPLNTDPIQTDIVLREDNGIDRIYDCFYLSSQ